MTENAKPPQKDACKGLYLDKENVERGYYVYLHVDSNTDDVFYVGKGHGRRAWDKRGRNSLWQKKVRLLDGHWDVKIAAEDLSEGQAFELERDLVRQYGGAAGEGGKLVNWFPGGENPTETDVLIDLPDDLQTHLQECATWVYDNWPMIPQSRAKRIGLLDYLTALLQPDLEQIEDMMDDAQDLQDETGDATFYNAATNIRDLLSEVLEIIEDYKKHRISDKDCCHDLGQCYWAVEGDEDWSHPKVKKLAKRSFELIKATNHALTDFSRLNE